MTGERSRRDESVGRAGALGWLGTALLGGLAGLAAVLRFYHLGLSSVWIDEGASVTMARLPWKDFVHTLWTYEANMAAYYLLLRGWIQIGDSEATLRSLSAVLGAATVVAIFFLGSRLFGGRAGFIAAGLLSTHLFHIWFSQEARSYALVILLATLSLYFFVGAVESPKRRRDWIAYVAATAVGAYGHLFLTLLVPAQWLALGSRRRRRIGVRRTMVVAASLTALLLPLAAFVLTRDQGQLNWIPPLDLPNVVMTLFAVNGFNPLLLLLVLIGFGLALRALLREDDDSFGVRLAAWAFVVPIVVVAIVSLWKPLFHFRHFAVCIPGAVVLAARVLSPFLRGSTLKRAGVVTAGGATFVLSLLMLVGYYQRFPNWAGDWRSATNYVLSHRRAGDAVAFYASAGLDSYRYYCDRVPGRTGDAPLPDVIFPPPGAIASEHLHPSYETLAEAAAHHDRLWVVLHLEELEDLPAPFPKPFRQVDIEDFTSPVAPMPLKVVLYEGRAGSDP